ncbi:NupC/NupG family nucleoside CNT transporter [Rhodopirellula bahusiensis]|uniref:NupC/NupG family nucleoside CNT transporter n=1 Tax=Rhodopirellula bahusiensis TaxID=2014065 RepID=A0A2G1W0I3_9BACT|nr:nucleoside transporter C-terminal domain-containing protein [Rhodopirellula bahusiensis]PHQ32534.1 NupC/NupG family nucleoside CNT transporter [Rhodopirellula bahusiensis]
MSQLNEIFPRMVCVLGIVVFVAMAWSISTDRRRFPWRIVIGGLLLQFTLAVLVLQTDLGRQTFKHIGDGFQTLMSTVDAGSGFLFSTGPDNPLSDSLLATFAFGVLPTVIFFSSLMSVLYHLGVMQRIVWVMAWVMKFSLKTSGPETLAAAANVFVGHTEAPLVVRPYLSKMSRSELCAMMTGGFATVTGGLLGAYAKMGVDISHLLTASIISAPAALLIAKVMVPDTPVEPDAERSGDKQNPDDDAMTLKIERTHVNVIGAAVEGASDGLKLALNVGAMLIAFLALIALIDLLLGGMCTTFGWVNSNDEPRVTLGVILGYACWPLAWLLGIPASECRAAGELIGLKTVANEFIAYQQLGQIVQSEEPTISARTATVLTYALAGFSNFAAIGIQVGGIGGLAPERKSDLASLGLRAMFGGLLACCMTGAIAGMML